MMKNNEIVVIFKRKKFKNNMVVYVPHHMALGHQDKKSLNFITKSNKTYNYMFNDDVEYGYGLRRTVKVKREDKALDVKSIEVVREYAKDYFETIKDFQFFFSIRPGEKRDNLVLTFRNPKTNDLYYIDDKDIDIAKKRVRDSEIINFDAKIVKEKIKGEIVGQDEAIDKIVTILWENMRSPVKNNILLIGPTGVGKTEIIRSISSKLNVPFTIMNATNISATGYVGDSVSDVLYDLLVKANYDLEAASHGIIYIDEIDKKASNSNLGDVGTSSVQDELLKLLEDGEYTIDVGEGFNSKLVTINTKNITFIAAGAFSELHEKSFSDSKSIGFNKVINLDKVEEITLDRLYKYGIKKELLGRLSNVIELNSLTEEDLIKIMKNPHNKTIQAKINLLKDLGIDTVISDDVYKVIAHNSIKHGLGARGLIGNVENLFNNAISEVSDNPNNYSKLIITKETVSNPKKYSLIKK